MQVRHCCIAAAVAQATLNPPTLDLSEPATVEEAAPESTPACSIVTCDTALRGTGSAYNASVAAVLGQCKACSRGLLQEKIRVSLQQARDL